MICVRRRVRQNVIIHHSFNRTNSIELIHTELVSIVNYPISKIRMNLLAPFISVLRRSFHSLRAINANLASYWINKKSKPLPTPNLPTIVFAPHPDDESLGCGGMIAIKQALGQEIRVIFVTDGAFSIDTTRKTAIASQRQQEATQALAELGIDRQCITFLNYPDGALHELLPAEQSQLIREFQAILAPYSQVEVFVPYHHDRHPDHEATYHLVKAALENFPGSAQLWQYPIWVLWKTPCIHFLTQTSSGWHSLSIGRVIKQKKRAIAAHRSQIEDSLPPGFLNRFLQPYEIFWKE